MKQILILMSAAVLFFSCHKDNDEPRIPSMAERTVVVYMAGETNLTDFAQDDIDEMIDGMKSVSDKKNNLVVFVDRASSTEKPFIARIRNDERHPVDTLYQYAEDFYSSDAEHFREVIQRIVTLCPAEDYGLVLWGHADGWIVETDSVASSPRRAYGLDNGVNTNTYKGSQGKWLNIPSMRQALEQLSVDRWKFIFCDCCNMQGAEVAYELRNLTDYLIASPAEITGTGAPYDTIVKDLFVKNDVSMYQSLCDDYYAQTDYVGGHLPISVVRTAGMPALAEATRAILPQVADYLKGANATDGLIYYFSYATYRYAENTLYDMNDVVRAALADDAAAYQAWRNVFDQAVVYSRMSTLWHANAITFSHFTVTDEKYGGMSMFFPLERYNTLASNYNETIRQMAWYYAVGWSGLGW